eukprot:2774555-Rhodomonas_salina.1
MARGSMPCSSCCCGGWGVVSMEGGEDPGEAPAGCARVGVIGGIIAVFKFSGPSPPGPDPAPSAESTGDIVGWYCDPPSDPAGPGPIPLSADVGIWSTS